MIDSDMQLDQSRPTTPLLLSILGVEVWALEPSPDCRWWLLAKCQCPGGEQGYHRPFAQSARFSELWHCRWRTERPFQRCWHADWFHPLRSLAFDLLLWHYYLLLVGAPQRQPFWFWHYWCQQKSQETDVRSNRCGTRHAQIYIYDQR